ncbi:membrane protein insertion efficiency factor YidD [filamentous cyanobacterium LEGE 11480]|uniref:Membrane protein insertion efficiency factor YidD n=1 Tax=Romeriopsis navalis LEGE 11480 TaxID=2777977 RepID=A0A928Z2V2_9CYAN|nr:membrane protein insertion efficiency factor YidD [Romeriopsis navalis]MBE9029432.1 membrane protein insertion efficiency factor YidD [Romeriopsis navalis LEGE 11480]
MHSTYRRGIIATSLTHLAPIGKLASSIGLSGAFDRSADFAVRKYQKHLSPRKGFSCAYTKLHGGPSCSAYFRELLSTKGFTQAIQPFQQRLQECHQANLTIRASRIQTIRTNRIQANGEDDNPQRKSNNPSNSDGNWCDVADCGCDIFSKDIGNCDTPDCGLGSCDSTGDCDILDSCSDCDAGICDIDDCGIGGCDVGDCDIGGCDGCDIGGCD